MEKPKYLIWSVVLILIIWQSSGRQLFHKNKNRVSEFSPNKISVWSQSSSLRQNSNEDSEDSSSQENDNCIRLPPNAKRSSASHEDQISFTNLMNGGFDNMITSRGYENATLVMGNTGVGKTTLSQIIAGDLNRIFAVYTSANNLVIVDDAERISAPSIVSRTLIPELITKTGDNSTIAFYDCPGFDDTRGPAKDVATNFFLTQVVAQVKRVKILFLILHSSVELGHERVDFDSLAQHATQFAKNMTLLKDSIGLVATKVKSYSHDGRYIKDRRIMKGIVEFLSAYRQTLHVTLESNSNPHEILKKIEFVNILLEKDERGQYNKISFSRDPEKCGPLSGSTEVAETRKRMVTLYEGLTYGEVEDPAINFGITLKADTIMKITSDFIPEINTGVVDKLADLVTHFYSWFNSEKLVRDGNYSTSLAFELNDLVKQTSVVLDDILYKNVERFNNFNSSAVKFGRILQYGLNEIGYSIPASFEIFLEKQDKMLKFFESIIGAKNVERRINDWINSLASLQAKMLDYKPWYGFMAELQGIFNSYEFHVNKSRLNFEKANDSRWWELIEDNNITIVDENIKSLELTFGPESSQGQLLHNMMQYGMVSTSITCESKKLTLKGNYVRFSEFVERSGNLFIPSFCDFNQTSKSVAIELFAANRVFIDVSINGLGKEYNLLIISPKWEVVERQVHLNFNGENGENIFPPKASDGELQSWQNGSAGHSGLAGKPGGPTGVFIGIVDKIEGHMLKITGIGGKGGAGQHGGNGGNGSEALPASRYYGWNDGKPGYSGGPGGDGGVGGLGGHVGLIKLKLLSDTSVLPVELSFKNGERGEFGLGGIGGFGGLYGQNRYCRNGWFDDSCYFGSPNLTTAPNGLNGSSNTVTEGLMLPVATCQQINEIEGIWKFKNCFSTMLDFELHKFVKKLYNIYHIGL